MADIFMPRVSISSSWLFERFQTDRFQFALRWEGLHFLGWIWNKLCIFRGNLSLTWPAWNRNCSNFGFMKIRWAAFLANFRGENIQLTRICCVMMDDSINSDLDRVQSSELDVSYFARKSSCMTWVSIKQRVDIECVIKIAINPHQSWPTVI